MSWFEHGESRIYYEEEGQGEPVLVLPGWAGSIGEFGPIRQALAPHFRVIAADLPGSGRSEPQPREYRSTYFHDDAGSILAMLDHLAAAPAHVIGFSDGGEVALLMAELRPESVLSVVSWGAAGHLAAPPEMLEVMRDLVDDPIPPMREFSDYLKSAYGEDNARVMTRSFANAMETIIAAGGDISRSQAASIECPVFLLTGEHDPFCPPALVSAMAAEIPNGEFARVDNAGHDVHISHTEWLTETVLDWLQQSRVDGVKSQESARS